ncbi:MAG: gluconate 2-dehydrogenase subunit 3 family protein [Chloroflexia bacterium]|nr:gluconate 2-dehydrogenase subunit 3 family protein [Chloroflexia bacterium]
MIDRTATGSRTFFDDHQCETIEAAMARVIPTDDHPGAQEAGTIYFLDRKTWCLPRSPVAPAKRQTRI